MWGRAKEQPPAVWSHHILAHGDQFAFPKNKQNGSEVASGHSSAFLSSSWKHPETIWIKGVDRTPTCAHTAVTALHTFIIKNHTLQDCPVLQQKQNPFASSSCPKNKKKPSPLACTGCPLHHKKGPKIRVSFMVQQVPGCKRGIWISDMPNSLEFLSFQYSCALLPFEQSFLLILFCTSLLHFSFWYQWTASG